MAYIAPIHRPSSIKHASLLSFVSPEEDHLVVAKANRLELYSQSEDGISLLHAQTIFGKVTMLNKFRPQVSKTDHLFVGTDKQAYYILSWDAEKKRMRTEKSYVDLAEKTFRDNQTGDRSHITPDGKYMTLELYEGVVTVVPFIQRAKKIPEADIGTLGEHTQTRIPELFVHSSCFLYPRRSPGKNDKPKMALLYEDSQSQKRLKIRELDYSAGVPGSDEPGVAEMENDIDLGKELDRGSNYLVPVPAPAGGVLVLGETQIRYFNEETGEGVIQALNEATIFVAWARIDNQRFLLADDYGRLYLLMLELDGHQEVEGWHIHVLGETSRANVLVYLDAGRLFVGSHQGDSQVLKIEVEDIEVIQTLPNIAPILDCAITDLGTRTGEGQTSEFSSGQARIITGSGAFKDGSLRSVRSGVGLEDVAVLGNMGRDLASVTNLFSIRSEPGLGSVDTLLVSLISETAAFKFQGDEVEEVDDLKGLQLSESTLLARNLKMSRIMQVTSTEVRTSDIESGMVQSSWSPQNNQSITDVSATDDHVLVAVDGVQLVLLEINSGSLRETAKRNFGADTQIACLTISDLLPDKCIIGFWQNSMVSTLKLPNLETLQSEQISEEGLSVPRSVLISQVLEKQPPTLFIAMADGNVVTFVVDVQTSGLSGKKSILLGTQQASFRELPRGNGVSAVVATCEHPSMIYSSEDRIVYSAVTAEDVSYLCPFDSSAFPNAVAIATKEDIKISLVDTERTTHVQTQSVKETVRRIGWAVDAKAFGLGTIKRELRDGYELVKSHFKLVDEVAFEVLDTYALNEEELVESVMYAELNDGTGELADHFVVGTAYLDEEEGQSDAIRGRILVFELTQERKLRLIAEKSLKGACRCLAMVGDKIAAALVKTVVIFGFEYETSSAPFLRKLCSYRTSTAPIDIAVTPGDNQIAVADLMKSVSVVQYKPGFTTGASNTSPTDTLEEVARHYQTTWATAVAHVGENMWVEADAEGNLLVLNRDMNGVTEDDRRRLQVTSEMNLGEMVNRIRRIDVGVGSDAVVVPKAFMATVEGSIYLFALISPSKQNLLMQLQARLAEFVQSPGHYEFNKYRAFKNLVREAEEPQRFVDGEFVERFLDCAPDVQTQCVEGLGVGVEDIKGMLEALRRLH
ncbi:DNA damage-binding protein 1 [Viridothelium virens]|uniref:DNA damage-binding protein 1 n=1 Tax=Viridothelium virens TaxID=1048519 RepID=A0A6A6GWL4_VIRVR|nr:DNA damage-binding protein 1 [Viridothelium virens]